MVVLSKTQWNIDPPVEQRWNSAKIGVSGSFWGTAGQRIYFSKANFEAGCGRVTVKNLFLSSSGTTQWIRSAAKITISIVSVYLVAKIHSVLTAIWEYVDLFSLHGTQFYAFSSDEISILTVISCLIRLPMNMWCDLSVSEQRTLSLQELCLCFKRIPSTSRESVFLDRRETTQWKTWLVHSKNAENGTVMKRDISKDFLVGNLDFENEKDRKTLS